MKKQNEKKKSQVGVSRLGRGRGILFHHLYRVCGEKKSDRFSKLYCIHFFFFFFFFDHHHLDFKGGKDKKIEKLEIYKNWVVPSL